MSDEPNKIKEKILNFDLIIKELHEAVAENEDVPKDVQLTLQDLDDGFSNHVATLSEIFIEANRRNNISLPNSFKKMPVVNSIENYPYPIILLNDEQELDAETQRIVRKRHENGFMTFPVILLSDQFFRLSYGENFAYIEIIKTFEEAAKEKVMVFRKSEFQFLKEYIISVKCIFWINLYRTNIAKMHSLLSSELESSTNNSNDLDNIASLVSYQHIKSIIHIYEALERIDKKLGKQTLEWQAEIADIREKYDRKVLEEIKHINAENISPFVLNIDLKYGALQGYIKDFLTLQEINNDYDFITVDLKQLVQKTEDAISSNKAKLSLIGTFSSGKTTLINTFLGERRIPLRTSMGHNTAVLMHLFHEKTDMEYYDIIYKDILKWTIVKPASMDKPVLNNENEEIRIINIEQGSNGNYLVTYSLIRSRETYSIRIRSKNGLAVKQGDILKKNESFTVIGKQISAMVEICSKAELKLIINLIASSNIYKLQNTDETINDKNTITNILKRIYMISSEKPSTLKYDEFCEKIGVKPSASKSLSALTGMQKANYPSKFRRIEIECNVGKTNERKLLDLKGWIELCGDPNPAKDEKPYIFSEQPECYMLAKELQLHVNTEFLQYCSLTDTPGFGSVTEEHDAITERYIRDSSGRLLVMIAINAKTIDAKYQDLINSIDDIYNNFRKADKRNVVFILNCFTNLSHEDNIRNQVEKVFQMLTKYGFNRNNIFVCNLKSALIDKQQTESMYGHPSYKRFHDFIITEMISSDLTEKYRGIQTDWKQFFMDSKKRIDDQIFDLESNINNIQQYKRTLQDSIDYLNDFVIDYQPFRNDYLKDEFQSMYDSVTYAYQNNRKGIFENIRWNAITAALSDVQSTLNNCNTELIETIYDYYNQCLRKIAYRGNSQISTPELNYPYISVAVLAYEQLKNLLSKADDETHWWNKSSKSDYYTTKVLEIIQEGHYESFQKAVDLCDEYAKTVRTYLSSVIREKQSALSGLDNEEKLKEHLNKLRFVRNNLTTLETRFGRIRFV